MSDKFCDDVDPPYDETDDTEWDDDDLIEECGLGDDGQCLLAGTEHCDFECPYRDSEDFAGSAAWCRKRGVVRDAR